MGVRGLTSYINKYAELYLTPYELHDCKLVIDGDNLACNLYKDVAGAYSAFGGDYDELYRSTVEFFHVLAECNISPYVLMDGGYERKKLRTVNQRLRGKISGIKRINPCGSLSTFPLFMKEVFVDAVKDCNVPIARCVFEADNELAALARKFNCPVLSYDSDFYIHNVKYIPSVTLTVKAHTKAVKKSAREGQNEVQSHRILRKNEVKHFQKRVNSKRILSNISINNVEKKSARKSETYKYLDCCMYRIENLIARKSLSKEKLPLFAALLGNDYIARSSFKNFFSSGIGKIGRGKKAKIQQRRIRVICQWLQHESVESALQKILSRLRKTQRESLLSQVEAAICGYSNEKSQMFEFFQRNDISLNDFDSPIHGFDEINEEIAEQEVEVDTDENDESYEEERMENEEEEESNDESDYVNDSEELPKERSQSDNCSVSSDEEDQENNKEEDFENDDKSKLFPDWFLEKLYTANLPRFFVDLIHLKMYINNPQIEHFAYSDCNQIALPILLIIFSSINSAKTEEIENESNIPLKLMYLTRCTKVTNVCYKSYEIKEHYKSNFNPHNPDPALLREPFTKLHKQIDLDKLFEKLPILPKDMQLYFLSIVYWLQTSKHCDILHLNALIICLVVISTVDSKIPPERSLKQFEKRFGKIVKKERIFRDKEIAEGAKRNLNDNLKAMPETERVQFISKSDCYLVQNNLLKHFHMQEVFKKKYDLYSSTVLHAFSEFQSVAFQMHSLNALLDFPYAGLHMGSMYCGVFIYNLYDLLKSRNDVRYYVQYFLLKDSQIMFDLYCFLLDWTKEFVPLSMKGDESKVVLNKRTLKKKRQAARRKVEIESEKANLADSDLNNNNSLDEDIFFDENNKFCFKSES